MSTATSDSITSDSLDDLMKDFGLVAPTPKVPAFPIGSQLFKSREDQFIYYITVKNPDKYRILLHFLQHEISKYWFLIDKYDVNMYQVNGPTGNNMRSITYNDFASIMIDYYLNMAYLPWFMPPKDPAGLGYNSLPACNRDVIVSEIMAMADTKKVLAAFKK